MNIKSILGVLFSIGVICIAYGIYLNYTTPDCYDGYGGVNYVEKELFLQALSSAESLDFIRNLSLAQEVYRCGDTTYIIKKDEGFREVSSKEFNLFIEEKNTSTTLFKMHQSGNSPLFADDVQTGKEYIVSQNNSKYILEQALRV